MRRANAWTHSAPVVKWKTKPSSQSTSATTNLLSCSLQTPGESQFVLLISIFRSLSDFLEDEEDDDDYDLDYEEDYHDDSWYDEYEGSHDEGQILISDSQNWELWSYEATTVKYKTPAWLHYSWSPISEEFPVESGSLSHMSSSFDFDFWFLKTKPLESSILAAAVLLLRNIKFQFCC